MSSLAKPFSKLERAAISIAELSLSGVCDKSGKPIIEHVRRVALKCKRNSLRFPVPFSTSQILSAWLHECIEDGGVSSTTINNLFGRETVEIVIALSRIPGEEYRKYIQRLSYNRLAIPVKLADLADNLDGRRAGNTPDTQRIRYLNAWKYLKQCIDSLIPK